MDLKEKMNAYTPQPDPELWNRIDTTLRHRRRVRRGIVGGSAAVVVAAALAVVLIGRTPEPTNEVVAIATPVIPAADPLTEEAPSVQTEARSVAVQPSTASQPTAPTTSGSQMVALPQSVAPAQRPTATAPQPAALPQASQPQASAAEAPAPSPSQPEAPKASAPAKATKSAPEAKTSTPITPQQELVVWLPTAFAPDAPDAEIRQFRAIPNEGSSISNFKMYIYNRGGRQVFYSTDINTAWDGRSKGQPQPMGAYTYKIEYTDATKGVQHYVGSVVLVR